MQDRTVSEFLDNDYADSALYISFRSTPNLIDGLKQSGRKVVYVCRKKNIKEAQKVSNLAGVVIDASQYLHGNTSLEGVIVTLAQDYCGSNNIPLLEGVGAFGTRMFPQASASRYIFAKQQPYFSYLFNPADDVNLIKQSFEGSEIEPQFYVPAIPLVLVNGSTGIGVGFSTKILCRSLNNMVTATRNAINGKRNLEKYFYPSWNNFKGTVNQVSSNKWEISGIIHRKSKNRIIITELPIPYTLNDYLSILRNLRDSGIVKKFYDNSDPSTDTFEFEVFLEEGEANKIDEDIKKDLKLVNTVTECFTCINENNTINEYSSAKEIFNEFIRVKMEYMQKRFLSETQRLTSEADSLKEIYTFIDGVVKGTIKVAKLSRSALEEQLKLKKFHNIDRLVSLPIYSLTTDKALEAKTRWEAKLAELGAYKKETPVTLWNKDLDLLEIAMKRK